MSYLLINLLQQLIDKLVDFDFCDNFYLLIKYQCLMSELNPQLAHNNFRLWIGN